MSKGKVVNLGSKGMYHEDGTWREGLVSAARLVVEATQSLYEAANEAAKNVLDIEFVIVSAKAVSSATVQLITAASVKADPNSKAHMKLKSAGKSVTDATDMLVLAAKSANCEPNTLADEKPLEAAPASTKTKVAEMDTMVNILRMEKELERARQSLATMRRGKYTQQTQAEVSVKDQQPRTTQHVSRQSIIVRQGVAARQSILAPKSGEESPARVQSKRLSRMID